MTNTEMLSERLFKELLVTEHEFFQNIELNNADSAMISLTANVNALGSAVIAASLLANTDIGIVLDAVIEHLKAASIENFARLTEKIKEAEL